MRKKIPDPPAHTTTKDPTHFTTPYPLTNPPTLIPKGASSKRMAVEKASTACFEAAYADIVGAAASPATELIFRILPLLAFSRGRQLWMTSITAK